MEFSPLRSGRGHSWEERNVQSCIWVLSGSLFFFNFVCFMNFHKNWSYGIGCQLKSKRNITRLVAMLQSIRHACTLCIGTHLYACIPCYNRVLHKATYKTCICTCAHTHTHLLAHTHAHAHSPPFPHIYHMYTCIHTYIHIHTHTHTDMHTHTCTRTHAHTHTHAHCLSVLQNFFAYFFFFRTGQAK